MPLDELLLKILVCPENKSPLSLASAQLIEQLNRKIEVSELKNHAGSTVKDKFSAGLLRQDGKRLYPIIDDIPVMLIDEGIDL